MADPASTITLLHGEYALVVGQDGSRMSVRVEGEHLDDEDGLPVSVVLVTALARRLLEDPDFHDEMLEWYEEHDEEDDEDVAGTA